MLRACSVVSRLVWPLGKSTQEKENHAFCGYLLYHWANGPYWLIQRTVELESTAANDEISRCVKRTKLQHTLSNKFSSFTFIATYPRKIYFIFKYLKSSCIKNTNYKFHSFNEIFSLHYNRILYRPIVFFGQNISLVYSLQEFVL